MLYPGEKVGCLSHGDTQTVSLVPQYLFRQFANLSKKEADKKSGRFKNFCSYLTDEFEMASVPSKTFLGNRFNILFVNGLRLYILYDKLLNLFNGIEQNKILLDAVYWDLEVLA